MVKYIIIFLLVALCANMQAQTRSISGIITGQYGEPLIGVSVVVKEKSKRKKAIGCLSNLDGEYRLSVDTPVYTLVFSYAGYYTQEITAGERTTINVRMREEYNTIDDHPVQPLYTPGEKKRNMAQSAVILKITHSTDERNLGTSNTLQQLNGLNPGLYVQPGYKMFSYTPNIRAGIGNIGGETNYMVDDLIDAPFNPAEMVTVDILPTPQTVAIWSAGGAPGGVLAINTAGNHANKDLWFSANAWLGVQPEAQAELVQHYDLRFSDQTDRIKLRGNASYDRIKGTWTDMWGERFTGRLVMNYNARRWLDFSQTVYYDLQKQNIRTIRQAPQNEMFSASTLKITPWRTLAITSTISYDWIDNREEQPVVHQWYATYKDYLDFRNQDNSVVKKWIWNNTAVLSHSINYRHELTLKGNYRREKADIRSDHPTVPEKSTWRRDKPMDDFNITGSYNEGSGTRVFSASVRRLSSTLLVKDNRQQWLPAFTVSWRPMREGFITDSFYNNDWISSILVNAGWGKSAHLGFYLPVETNGGYKYQQVSYEGLNWQITQQADARINLGLLDEQLFLSATYYHKKTDHLPEYRAETETSVSILPGNMQVVNEGWEFAFHLNQGIRHITTKIGGNVTINNSTLKNISEDTHTFFPGYIAPKYYYGIKGNLTIRNFAFNIHANGVADMYVDLTRVNYFALKSIQVIYSPKVYNLIYKLRADVYMNVENLFFKTNGSLKHTPGIDYAIGPVNRMISVGMKIYL